MKTFLYPILFWCCLCTEIQAHSEWTPRSLDNLMGNGSNSGVTPQNATGGVLRQEWLNTLDGFFNNEWRLATAYRKDKQEAYDDKFQMSLVHRLWWGFDMPFVEHIGNETDVGVTVKPMFHESQDLSISGGIGARFATGDRTTGGNTWGLFPHLVAWPNVRDGWPLHGDISLDMLPDKTTKSHYLISENFAVAQTIIPHNAVFGDFADYSAANIKIPLDNRRTVNPGFQIAGVRGSSAGKSQDSAVFLTPDIRTRIANNAFILFGLERPVANPNPFGYQVNLVLVKSF